MEIDQHEMSDLFEQLGLGSSPQQIEDFIKTHRNKRDTTSIYEASYWTKAQADFLKQALEQDADWAELVDQLDVMLRD